MCSFCLLPRRSSSRLSPAGSSSPAVLLTKKANAQLALFHCLTLPCGARTQCWRSMLRASVLLSWWQVWEVLNHLAMYRFLQLSPQQARGLSLQYGAMAACSSNAQERGWAFCPHPLAPHPHRHFPALQLLWFPSVTGPSGATVSSSAELRKMLKDQTLHWPRELRGCGFGENGLHAYFPFLFSQKLGMQDMHI